MQCLHQEAAQFQLNETDSSKRFCRAAGRDALCGKGSSFYSRRVLARIIKKTVFEHFGMQDAKLTESNCQTIEQAGPEQNLFGAVNYRFRLGIENLMFLMIGAHPDIGFAVSPLSHFPESKLKHY